MLIIDGKRVTDFDSILEGYNKVVTLTLKLPSAGRQTADGKVLPPKPNINIPMRFQVADPNKGGKTIQVIYSEFDDIPIDNNGMIGKDKDGKEYQPKPYKIRNVHTKLKKETDSELMCALAYSTCNADNILYAGKDRMASSQPLFSMPLRGASQVVVSKDEFLMKGLNYLSGENKISNTKAVALYKTYVGFDDELVENDDFAAIRAKLSAFVKEDSEKFVKIIEDTMYDTKAKVAEAFERGILVASDKRKITWGTKVEGRDHTATICMFGIGEDKIDFFTAWLTRKDVTGEVRDCMLKNLESATAQ